MNKARQYERISRVVDLVIQPGEPGAVRFAGRAFNISRGGFAVFSPRHFPPGVLLAVEMTVPVESEGLRRVVLYGVTRWANVEDEGVILGIELQKDGDYAWFVEHFDLCVGPHGRRGGTTGAKRLGPGVRSDR